MTSFQNSFQTAIISIKITALQHYVKDEENGEQSISTLTEIINKVERLLKKYTKCMKNKSFDCLDEIFDITKLDGEWLSTEDKKLYLLQVETSGQVGYSTGKPASKATIHPSKRRRTATGSSDDNTLQVTHNESELTDTTSDGGDTSQEEWQDQEESKSTKHKRAYNKTGVGRRLVTGSNLSSRKAAKVCQQLSGEGVAIATPSQSAIHKALYRRATELKAHYIRSLHQQNWCLHFDGKHLDGAEHQAVLLKNESEEVKLTTLKLRNGKADTIAEGLGEVLEEFNLWESVKMIIADTTSVNTGKKSGVVVRLQRMFEQKGFSKPQFVSCQHHVLDRVLRVVMDEELHGTTKSPNIEYFFMKDLLQQYENLTSAFKNGTVVIEDEVGWRDDMKFLFHLTRAFRFFAEKKAMPRIKFHKLPNLSNARWNSRAIYALIAYILMPSTRTQLHRVCYFVAYEWADKWFADQLFRDEDYDELYNALKPYSTALKCLQNHWKREDSTIKIGRSNQCCERAIKTMQELHALCMNKDNLPLRFLLSNERIDP